MLQLTKSQSLNLTKTAGNGLSNVTVGLGWDPAKGGLFGGLVGNIDCDAFAILLTNSKLASKSDIIYFSNKTHSSGAVKHGGDNLTGKGKGDDEKIFIELGKLPQQYDKIIIGVNVYSGQTFGKIENAFIRIVDNRNNNELCRYNLSGKEYAKNRTMTFGALERVGNEWQFTAIGEGNDARRIPDYASRL